MKKNSLSNGIIIAAAFFFVCHACILRAEEQRPGPGEKYSSGKYINFNPSDDPMQVLYPIVYYFNTAFDTAQEVDNYPEANYFENHWGLINYIYDPYNAINKSGGWEKFFSEQFGSTASIPNYTLHMLGGGYDFRTLWEWYDYNGFPLPYGFALLTYGIAQFGNEALEYKQHRVLTSRDPIADLFFFNLFGVILFTSDTVARFFHDTMQMRSWSGQPLFSLTKNKIINASNNYAFRPYLFGTRVRPFVYIGLHYLFGVSVKIGSRDYLSAGIGAAATRPIHRELGLGGSVYNKVRPAGGLFWDRNDRLLASLILNGTEDYMMRLNIYPDFFYFEKANIGLFVAITDDRHPVFGMALYKVIAPAL